MTVTGKPLDHFDEEVAIRMPKYMWYEIITALDRRGRKDLVDEILKSAPDGFLLTRRKEE